jgi:membrane fusion protein, multidrug efflux system
MTKKLSEDQTPFQVLMRASRLGVLAGLLLSVGLLAGCSSENSSGKAPASMAYPAVPVTVATAGTKNIPVRLHAIGTVEAYSTVTVKSQVDGIIQQVHFREGQDVKAGDLLFSIDPRPFQAQLDQAQANLARDAAQAKNAQAQAARYASLYQSGIVSKDQYDTYQTNFAALQAAVRADQAAVETAKLNLSYCTIRSPIDGRTGSLLVHAGNLIKTNDTSLLVINRIEPIYVDFSVPEQNLGDIKKFMAERRLPVEAAISGDPDRVEGVLDFVNNSVDNTTGTIMLKGLFTNHRRRLWPGQFVDVYLQLSSQANATVVPSQAIQTGQKGLYIYVVKPDKTVEIRPIQVGNTYQGDTVIEKGIAPGDEVVTDGQLLLRPGAKVTIKAGAATAQESRS